MIPRGPDWVEVWSEKGTIRGTLAPVLQGYGVTFRVMHGYGSATAINQVATESREAGKTLIVFYVGDWDPSGLHMSEVDLERRLALSPVVLRDRVADAIDGVLDHDAWDRAEVVEKAEQESLQSILSAWPGISGSASKYDEGRP